MIPDQGVQAESIIEEKTVVGGVWEVLLSKSGPQHISQLSLVCTSPYRIILGGRMFCRSHSWQR